jgi:hypothetical protein
MSRQVIREMKRSLAAAAKPAAGVGAQTLARESALALLDRSIVFGHRRLAVIRLAMAVNSGADLTLAHWTYCREAAEQSRDAALQAVLRNAIEAASLRTPLAPADVH